VVPSCGVLLRWALGAWPIGLSLGRDSTPIPMSWSVASWWWAQACCRCADGLDGAPAMVGGRVVPQSPAGGFGQLLWSLLLVSGAQGSSAGSRGWSRILLFTAGGVHG
jgi:hypothetical protein